MKALIYCRVSSQRQVEEGHGNDSQEKRCRDYAADKDYLIEKVFLENGVSGGLFERPAIKELFKYIDEHIHENYVVIFDDLSRFARDVAVHIRLKAEFASRGAKLECLNFNFDDSPESEYAELVLAVGNQYQRKSNKRQVVQKMKARLERGYWPFMPPLGMINKKDPIHGKILTPREPYASIYKMALEQYRDRLLITQQEVMLYLHKEYKDKGLPNRPSMSTTQRILCEPLYAGYVRYDKWGIPFKKAQHEGFISLETYNVNQKRLQERTKPWKRRDSADTFPLRPHVLCDACSKPMTASWCTGRKGIRYPHYFCRNKICIYKWKTTAKTKFEAKFEELLLKVKPKADMVDLTKDILIAEWNNRLENYSVIRGNIRKELDKIQKGVDDLAKIAGRTKDDIVRGIYEEQLKGLVIRQKELKEELKDNKYTPEQFGTASKKVFDTLKRPMDMWQSNEYNDKRTILFMYFEDKLRYDYFSGFGTANLAYPLELITKNRSLRSGSVEMSGSEPESKKTF